MASAAGTNPMNLVPGAQSFVWISMRPNYLQHVLEVPLPPAINEIALKLSFGRLRG